MKRALPLLLALLLPLKGAAAELSEKVRTFARLAASLQEEAEAIGWYEQRISLEKDPQAKAIMEDA